MKGDHHALAAVISAAVVDAWHGAFGGSAREVPLSVVAALSLLRPGPWLGYQGLDARVLEIPPGGPFLAFLRDIWSGFTELRPDLFPRVYPLIRWVFREHSPSELDGAFAVATAAVRAGQLYLPSRAGRYEIDLFGRVWQDLSGSGARRPTGQFFTPDDVAATLAAFLAIDNSSANTDNVLDPCTGTGGLLLGAAEAMRAAGRDPAAAHWTGVDLDPIVLALCAVNTHIWAMGKNVLLGVGDCLADDWQPKALAERREAISVASTAQELRRVRTRLQTLGIADFTGPTLHAGRDDHTNASNRGASLSSDTEDLS